MSTPACIPDTSCQEPERARHRQRQARCKAALAGMASGALRRASTPLTGPNYLPEGAEDDPRRVGNGGLRSGPAATRENRRRGPRFLGPASPMGKPSLPA